MFEKYIDTVVHEQIRVGQIYESIFGNNPIQDSLTESKESGGAIGAGVGSAVAGLPGAAIGAAIGAKKGKGADAAMGALKGGFVGSLGGAAVGGLGGAALGGAVAGPGGAIAGGVGGAILGGNIGGIAGSYKGAKSAEEEPDESANSCSRKNQMSEADELDEGLKKALIGGVVGSTLGAGLGYVGGGKYGEQIGDDLAGQLDKSASSTADKADALIGNTTGNVNREVADLAKNVKTTGTELIANTADSAGQTAKSTIAGLAHDATAQIDTTIGDVKNPNSMVGDWNARAQAIGDKAGHDVYSGIMTSDPDVVAAQQNLQNNNYEGWTGTASKLKDKAIVTAYNKPASMAKNGVSSGVTSTIKGTLVPEITKAADKAKVGVDSFASQAIDRVKTGVDELKSTATNNYEQYVDKNANQALSAVSRIGKGLKDDTRTFITGAYNDVKPIVKDTTTKLGKVTGAGIGASIGGLTGTLVGASMPNDKDDDKKQHKQRK